MRKLELWQTYDREEVHGIFSPDTAFTPQTGTWGLQGIVRVPDNPGDFVFFVTFGKTQGTHSFAEDVTEDGVLSWQSQPKQRLGTPMIQELVRHNDLTNSIHLFLRANDRSPYTYLGELGYLDHDPTREAPVYFTWQLLAWPAPAATLSTLHLQPTPTGRQSEPPPADTLIRTNPPRVGARTKRTPRGGRKYAYLPGQDARNHALGLAGETLVLRTEAAVLRANGRPDLADKVEHVSVTEGDSAGYDIRSYGLDGAVRHIEVKTTAGPAANAFYISPAEVRFSERHPDTYALRRLYDYSKSTNSARYYQLDGAITDCVELEVTEYRARLQSASDDD